MAQSFPAVVTPCLFIRTPWSSRWYLCLSVPRRLGTNDGRINLWKAFSVSIYRLIEQLWYPWRSKASAESWPPVSIRRPLVFMSSEMTSSLQLVADIDYTVSPKFFGQVSHAFQIVCSFSELPPPKNKHRQCKVSLTDQLLNESTESTI